MMGWESSAYRSKEYKIIQKQHSNWKGNWLRKYGSLVYCWQVRGEREPVKEIHKLKSSVENPIKSKTLSYIHSTIPPSSAVVELFKYNNKGRL